MPNAIVTGGSSGLGLALTRALVGAGWQVSTDGRRAALLADATRSVAGPGSVTAVPGDITDPAHRSELVRTAHQSGPVDLLVNNASELGGSPPPRLADLDPETSARLWRVNVDGPLQLVRAALPHLAPHAVVVAVSSDAAVEHYPGWGGYAAAKAALDHQTLTWAAEEPRHTWYAVDPGDLRTPMHQAAFPGEDISDRPEPAAVAPVLLALVGSGLPSGRYRLGDLGYLVAGSPAVRAGVSA